MLFEQPSCDYRRCGCKKNSLVNFYPEVKLLWFEIPKCASSYIRTHFKLQHKVIPRDKIEAYLQQSESFAVVRNPWDRVWSNYRMLTNERVGLRDNMFPELPCGWTFDWFIRQLDQHPNHHWRPCSEYLPRDKKGCVLLDQVDHIFYFEHLKPLFAWLKKKSYRDLNFVVHRKNTKPYREQYTPETRDIVAKLFKQDIDTFEYKF